MRLSFVFVFCYTDQSFHGPLQGFSKFIKNILLIPFGKLEIKGEGEFSSISFLEFPYVTLINSHLFFL